MVGVWAREAISQPCRQSLGRFTRLPDMPSAARLSCHGAWWFLMAQRQIASGLWRLLSTQRGMVPTAIP